MRNEQFTEELIRNEMKINLGMNPFGYVFPQGDVNNNDKIMKALLTAGGKPAYCSLSDFSINGVGKAKPEYIITFNKDRNTIIVIECKKSVKTHCSENMDRPRKYAVDGALYYAKYLKKYYNVIAVGISGTKKDNYKSNAYYWVKNSATFMDLNAKDIILEPENYIKLVKGEELIKNYSIDEIRETAIDMHNYLREIKMSEKHKPLFIAGILIALSDSDFMNNYPNLTSFFSIVTNLKNAIEDVLKKSGIHDNRIRYINQAFTNINENSKFKNIPLDQKKSITWYIDELAKKIKPMMDYSDSTVDALGVFYHEFIKYSGGDGKGLGIVLTPQHLTEFMCEVAGINKNSKVVDICCGSGAFLVTAMSKMFRLSNSKEIDHIRREQLFGVEFDPELFTLALANMIVRQDGKSNIIHGDCFNEKIIKDLKEKNINIGLINPPYSQKDKVELEFVEQLLNLLTVGGIGVVVVPLSCAIGTKFVETRERLFKNHKLKAVFSMPDDIFYPAGTNVCVMVWEAHSPHDSSEETFFGYYKNDGFVKKKKLGRIDDRGTWKIIEKKWLSLYKNKDIVPGLTARKSISFKDEWLCEAYMETDYSNINNKMFKKAVRSYLSYKVAYGKTDLKSKFRNTKAEEQISSLSNWKWFNLYGKDGLFEMYAGRYYDKLDYSPGHTPYVSAKDMNNGVSEFINVKPRYKANSITIGKVGCTAYYQSEDFCATSDVTILSPKTDKFNVYIGLFIATVINMEHDKWSYGRQIRLGDSKKLKIKLPADIYGNVDWKYMEDYIKSLPYGNII